MSSLINQLRERAAKNPRRIVYPESTDARVLRAAAKMVELGMAKPILVGAPEAVEQKARESGTRLSHIEIVDSRSGNRIERYARLLLPDWKSRGVTEVEAHQRLEKPAYF